MANTANEISPAPLLLQLAIDTPLRRLFDYLPPPGCDPALLQPGIRLRVPFGRREQVGVLVRVSDSSELPAGKLRPALAVIDREPVFDAALLRLLLWAAEYYQHPTGKVLASALPTLARTGAPAMVMTERWLITAAGAALLANNALRRAPRQTAMLRRLAASPGATADELGAEFTSWRAALRQLLAKGWAASVETAPTALPVTRALTDAQLLLGAAPTRPRISNRPWQPLSLH